MYEFGFSVVSLVHFGGFTLGFGSGNLGSKILLNKPYFWIQDWFLKREEYFFEWGQPKFGGKVVPH